jgi:hypothetical protein
LAASECRTLTEAVESNLLLSTEYGTRALLRSVLDDRYGSLARAAVLYEDERGAHESLRVGFDQHLHRTSPYFHPVLHSHLEYVRNNRLGFVAEVRGTEG